MHKAELQLTGIQVSLMKLKNSIDPFWKYSPFRGFA